MEDGLVKNYEEIWTINYEDLDLGKVIGKGAFGEVYHGHYYGAEVAVKKLGANDEEDELYLDREVGALKSIRHPNIVTFMGVCKKPGEGSTIYIITEFVAKGSLRQNIKSKNLSWAQRGRIALDIACAMAYLHSRSIIFRDLKSKNVLLDDNMRAKICDFGFARLTTGIGKRVLTLCGTDDWMAPEVILGMEYDTACDVYSYGIVLFELITRKKVSEAIQRSPMDGFDLEERKTRKSLPSDAPPQLVDLAFSCCQYNPTDRPSFMEVVKILAELTKSPIFEDADALSNPPPVAIPAPAPAPAPTPSVPQSAGRGIAAARGAQRGRAIANGGGIRGAASPRGAPRGSPRGAAGQAIRGAPRGAPRGALRGGVSSAPAPASIPTLNSSPSPGVLKMAPRRNQASESVSYDDDADHHGDTL